MSENKLTVQDAIDRLMGIEDKTQLLKLEIAGPDGFRIDHKATEIYKYDKGKEFEKRVTIIARVDTINPDFYIDDNQVIVTLSESNISAIESTGRGTSKQSTVQKLFDTVGAYDLLAGVSPE